MDLIKKEATEMVKEKRGGLPREAQLHTNVSSKDGFKSSPIQNKSETVGFDDERHQLKDMLVGGDSSRHIIPIVGMGGIGKTTLARNIFVGNLIQEYFDVCMWATISQDCNIEQTLKEILSQAKGESSREKSVGELGEELHKYLWGRRYLIVLDDMWSIVAWDKMKFFFPDCGEGSRIVVTTRMSNLAGLLTNSSNSVCMSFLNELDSWTLFSKTISGSEGSDLGLEPELREMGEKIVGKCKGLPLSIVVVGGLLSKTERKLESWGVIEKSLSSIVNSENEEYCLRILKMSYNHLPAYLKPCFLYMGVFDEDSEIKVSIIIDLWVSKGFIRPSKKEKNLELVAREYFQELVDRNLVVVADKLGSYMSNRELDDPELGWVGMAKLCRVHDLVRDLSLREAKKQRFYYVYSEHNPSSSHRRIVVPDKIWDNDGIDLESSPHSRSYVCHDCRISSSSDFRLLRTLHTPYRAYRTLLNVRYVQKDVFGLVNLRLLAITLEQESGKNVIHSSIRRLWSLQKLLVYCLYELT